MLIFFSAYFNKGMIELILSAFYSFKNNI